MSDGGDGFGEVLSALLSAEVRQVQIIDAAHQPRTANWWWEPRQQIAVIESAQVIGLALLPPGMHHPFALDTFGLRAVLNAAVAAAARRCVIGIGGSATNDGGFGLALAFGWKFIGSDGQCLGSWTELDLLVRIIPPVALERLPEIQVAVDVQNPLLGPTGASRIYGPQKGLRGEDMPRSERCLGRLLEVCERDLGLTPSSVPGDGAAGGLGFGLRCFLNAHLESGFGLFAHHALLEERIRESDLVITGEGAIDVSTSMGKGVGEIARICQTHQVPCIGLAGSLGEELRCAQTVAPFSRVHAIVPELTVLEEAKRNAAVWLQRLAAELARNWN